MKKILRKLYLKFFNILKFLKIKQIIIFESYPTLSDNTLVLYNKLIEDNLLHNYKIIWLDYGNSSKSETIKNVHFLNVNESSLINKIITDFKISYEIARSKMYIFSHRNYSKHPPKKGQYFINLTHGMSLKDTRGNYVSPMLSSHILTLSEFTKELRALSFEGGKDKMLNLGFPRNDLLFSENKIKDFKQFKKIIVWLPTFRRKETGENHTNTSDEYDLPIIKDLNQLEKLNHLLNSLNIKLIIKPHPAQKLDNFIQAKLENVEVISNEDLNTMDLHLYELLANSDALISDYSSVYVDYLLTDNMIAFAIDDYEEYMKHKGFLVENPLEYMPGHKLKNMQDLRDFITDVSSNIDSHAKERLKMKQLFHQHTDNKSTKRVTDLIESLLKGERL